MTIDFGQHGMRAARRVHERAAKLLEHAVGERRRAGAAPGEGQDEQGLRIVVRERVTRAPAVAAAGLELRQLRRWRTDRAAAEPETRDRREEPEVATGYSHSGSVPSSRPEVGPGLPISPPSPSNPFVTRSFHHLVEELGRRLLVLRLGDETLAQERLELLELLRGRRLRRRRGRLLGHLHVHRRRGRAGGGLPRPRPARPRPRRPPPARPPTVNVQVTEKPHAAWRTRRSSSSSSRS